jgi:hypothetical protein
MPVESETARRVTAWLRPFAHRNLFNPSVLVARDQVHVAFRAYREMVRERPFHAYYARTAVSGLPTASLDVVDLTEHAARHGVAPVADPKLFALGDVVFVTFNSGDPETGDNDIHVMQVHPELAPPQRCVWPERRRIEKNWGFYAGPGGRLTVVYSIDPLVRLRLVDGVPGQDGELLLEREPDRPVCMVRNGYATTRARTLAQGSQPVVLSPSAVVLMAHEKRNLRRFKAYLGRLVLIEELPDRTKVTIGRDRWLGSSLRSAVPFPARFDHFSMLTTYVAGLTVIPGGLLVSYGVDNATYGVAELPDSALGDPGLLISARTRGGPPPSADHRSRGALRSGR